MDIKKLCFEDMLGNIIPRVVLTRYKNAGINIEYMVNGSDICLTDGRTKNYFISVPYEIRVDGDRQEIHGNTRNKIAKDFVQEYTIERIYALEQEFIDKEILAEKQYEIEKAEMQIIMQREIAPLFPQEYLKYLEIKEWAGRQILINFTCEYENPLSRWADTYRNKIEIYFDKHNLNSFQLLTNNKNGMSERERGLRIEFVKKECIRVINECLHAKETYEKQKVEAKAISDKKNLISTFAWNAFVSKTEVYILRKKNSFTAVCNGLKFSVGTGKEGKYIKIKLNQIADMIEDKGYDEYCKLPRDADCLFNSEKLKALDWTKICA